MTLTQPAIDAAAATLDTAPLHVGDVVQFESSAYGRMMYLSMSKHALRFMTQNGFIHEEPRPVRNKFWVVGSVDISLLKE